VTASLNRAILGMGRYHLARSNRKRESVAVCGFKAVEMNVTLAAAEKANGIDARCRKCFG
jgi:hypothetical protein